MGDKDGVAKLYIDGRLDGTLTGWNQQFTWGENETSRLLLGLHYIGLIDEFSCFNRALTAEEVKSIFQLEGGISRLLKREPAKN